MAGEPNGTTALLDRAEIDALKAGVDLAEVVRADGVELRKLGRNLVGRCPFHEDAEASLVVNPERNLWNCFGCRTGGDVFSFVQLREGLAFPEALERVRRLAGQLPALPSVPRPAEPEVALPGGHSRVELLERVAGLYREALLENREAQQYLTSRGLGSSELWEAFRVGYADGRLLETLPREGELREALVALGVLNERGGEHLAGCVVVPLEHPDGGVVGLYGRRIAARTKVRHLYLPGPRRGVVNWQALHRDGPVHVTEGVLDAMSLWAAGCRDATALYGVQGLPPDLDALLGRYAVREIRLVLDGDRAGREATERLAAELAGRGVRCWQVHLPEDQDPNGVLTSEGPSALAELLRAAEPPATAPTRETRREDTGDGFMLRFDDLLYRVTPRPPFTGRLRVTVKVARGSAAFLDTFDLYSHRARTGAVNQVQRRLELPREDVERHFLALLEEAEAWVQALSTEEGEDPGARQAVPEMSAAEREEALEFLRRPDLVPALLQDMQTLGYVGEEHGKILAYLIGLSRKLDRPLSGIVLSQSGAGKSGLAELLEQLTPPEDVVLYSRLSAQALGYLPRDFLKRKLLILEERTGAEAADYQIRVLQSRQRLSQAVVVKDPASGKMQTRHFEVEGPIAYLETTTNPRINHENATRCFEISLDETEEQTRRIHERQRRARSREGLAAREDAEALRRRHHNAQRLLEPVRVLIPFVEHLSFPSRWLRTRRDHERFLCLVEAAAFLHQHQRETELVPAGAEPVRAVLATLADYRLAYDLARDVLGVTLHELSRPARDLWEAARALVRERSPRSDPGEVLFTRRDLRTRTSWPDRRLLDALLELVDLEYVGVLAAGQGRTALYRLLVLEETGPLPLRELTHPDELASRLEGRAALA